MAKTELINIDDPKVGYLSETDLQVLEQAQIIPKGTPASQVQVFANICKEKGLSPFSKEIYLVGYGGKYSVITGINGFRKLASETGQHAGTDDVKFDLQPNGAFFTAAQLKANNQMPTTATVTVYRIVAGMKASFTHTAVFKEFNSGKQKWVSMPFQMVSKVAEAFALRKGFSDKLTGLNVEGEVAAINDDQKKGNGNIEHRGVVVNDIDVKQVSELDEVKKEVRELYGDYQGNDKDLILEDIKENQSDIEGLRLIISKIKGESVK